MLISLKPKRHVNLNVLYDEVTRLEAGVKQVSRAQAGEVSSCLLDLLAAQWETNPRGVVDLFKQRHSRPVVQNLIRHLRHRR